MGTRAQAASNVAFCTERLAQSEKNWHIYLLIHLFY
jgi:hypothetical protein